MATQTQSSGVSTENRSVAVRAVWFVFVGWWATGLWLTVAWVLNLSIIGLPVGIKMINVVPKVLTLKDPEDDIVVDADGNVVGSAKKDQHSLVVRGVWFVFVGWWASGIWMGIAYLLSLTILGLPVAIIMYNKLPFVVSLYKY
ncbi:YccF domain-containing protein [Natronosalvus caseinilyticus]|uniref:YccF domain-containing protein n=1 Tax=Natronosalvus caseinilyticus TaxID=2953747 RepID=UPI0028AB0FDF|nr:YccF domain-containing protein [Natronosalvus caseinilyticus]